MKMEIISDAPHGREAAKTRLADVIKDAGARTIAIVRKDDEKSRQLAETVDVRTQAMNFRRCVWVKDEEIIAPADAAKWFGNDDDIRGVVLASPAFQREVKGRLRFDEMSLQIEKALLAADKMRPPAPSP